MTYCKYCGADLPPNKKIRNNKQIKIEELIPFMKEGWVAMDEDGTWLWYQREPYCDTKTFYIWFDCTGGIASDLSKAFNIAPAKDWTKSLIRIKGEKQDDK